MWILLRLVLPLVAMCVVLWSLASGDRSFGTMPDEEQCRVVYQQQMLPVITAIEGFQLRVGRYPSSDRELRVSVFPMAYQREPEGYSLSISEWWGPALRYRRHAFGANLHYAPERGSEVDLSHLLTEKEVTNF